VKEFDARGVVEIPPEVLMWLVFGYVQRCYPQILYELVENLEKQGIAGKVLADALNELINAKLDIKILKAIFDVYVDEI